jgi:WD40 repeat protein
VIIVLVERLKVESIYGRSVVPSLFCDVAQAPFQIASGILFNFWDAHYRRVNVLRFTNDGTVLVSGSEDSSVNVWIVAKYVSTIVSVDHHLTSSQDSLTTRRETN